MRLLLNDYDSNWKDLLEVLKVNSMLLENVRGEVIGRHYISGLMESWNIL